MYAPVMKTRWWHPQLLWYPSSGGRMHSRFQCVRTRCSPRRPCVESLAFCLAPPIDDDVQWNWRIASTTLGTERWGICKKTWWYNIWVTMMMMKTIKATEMDVMMMKTITTTRNTTMMNQWVMLMFVLREKTNEYVRLMQTIRKSHTTVSHLDVFTQFQSDCRWTKIQISSRSVCEEIADGVGLNILERQNDSVVSHRGYATSATCR